MKMTLRMWILVFFLVASLFAIRPWGYLETGVVVKTIEPNSPASLEGLSKGEIIKEINDDKIKDIEDYRKVAQELFKDIRPVDWEIKTSNGTFEYSALSLGLEIDENLTLIEASSEALLSGLAINTTVLEINGEPIEKQTDFYSTKRNLEPSVKLNIQTKRNSYTFLTQSIGLTVAPVPQTNLKAGLDLAGGARAIVKPEKEISTAEMEDLIAVTTERLNVFGLSDVVVRGARDLEGNNFMVVEVAGSTPKELEELIGQQGKFEAKIGNETVFIGGKNDITSVCKGDPTCAGVRECRPSQGGYNCRFDFAIYLSETAAERQASLTANLSENLSITGERYLSKSLDLYLDDKLVDTLQISSSLKGKAITQISISGPGVGATQQEAYDDALKNMGKLQTVLVTGSLPFKLQVVKLDSISPLLGKDFIKNIFYAGLASFLAVALVVFIRYRKIQYSIPVMITLISEIWIILGAAALIRWNLDLSSIAGIIAAIGTGVNDQIILLDESSKKGTSSSVKERIKTAFFIIFGAFATNAVAMIPLFWAGAGLIRGFALTTLVGIAIGVFITRPAFANFIGQLEED